MNHEEPDGPAGFRKSLMELRNMFARAGVRLEKVSLEKAVSQSSKVRRLEWKRISSIRAKYSKLNLRV
jgi:hypothetical protein